MLLVGLKMPHLPHLRIKQFSQQKNPQTFKYLLSPSFMQKITKK